MICLFDIYFTLLNSILVITNYFCGTYNNIFIFIITLLSYFLHDLFINKISLFINFFIKNNFSNSFKQSIFDLIKYSSIFIFQNILFNGKLNLSINWLITNYSLIFGYIIFNYIEKYLPLFKNLNLNNILLDNIKVTLGFILQYIFINKYDYFKNLSEIMAYSLYHLFTKKIII